MCFPDGSDGKESVCHAGDPGSIPGLGRSPGEGDGEFLMMAILASVNGHSDHSSFLFEKCFTFKKIYRKDLFTSIGLR